MKFLKFLAVLTPFLLLFSCVSKKKYNSLTADYKLAQEKNTDCNDRLKSAVALNTDLTNQKNLLATQVDYLKKNSTEVLSALPSVAAVAAPTLVAAAACADASDNAKALSDASFSHFAFAARSIFRTTPFPALAAAAILSKTWHC